MNNAIILDHPTVDYKKSTLPQCSSLLAEHVGMDLSSRGARVGESEEQSESVSQTESYASSILPVHAVTAKAVCCL